MPLLKSEKPEESSTFLAPLRHRTYRQMWVAHLCCYFGASFQMTGAGWLMTMLTKDSSLIALVQGASALAMILFAMAAGAIADNFDRRKVMLLANTTMLVSSLLLVVMTLMGTLTPWWLLTFIFLISCGWTLDLPSWQASVGDLVPRRDIPGAVTLNAVNFNLSRSFAPALGGLIISASGPFMTFLLNAVSYFGVIGVLLRWPKVQEERTLPRERIGRSIALGVRFAAMSPEIRRVLLRGCAFGFGGVALHALLPVIARTLLKGGPQTYGLLLGAFGMGGLMGALINGRAQKMMRKETMIRVCFMMTGAALMIVGFSRNLWLTCGALVMMGSAYLIAFSIMNVSVQFTSPRWVVGRTLAIYQVAVFSGFLVGSWVWGQVAEHGSVPMALWGGAISLVAGAALGIFYPLMEPTDDDFTPSGEWREPELALKIQPNSGPIQVEAEYLIAEEDTQEFRLHMEKRRRARIRDGAHHWSMLRDLHDPQRWRVSYQFPTWLEYVRHNSRVTEGDALETEEVLALHRGPERPVVRRWIERPAFEVTEPRPTSAQMES